MKKVFELNKEQQKAFNRLKKAYKDCGKLGILFVNEDGYLQAFDKKYINDFGDDGRLMDGIRVKSDDQATQNYITVPDPWVDDRCYYSMTEAGYKLYCEENDEEE